jgi:penicillin amidase
VQRSTVLVRGGKAVDVEAIETERGTVVTELREQEGALVGWSVRLPARTNRDLGASALLPLLRARTAADVVEAFGSWVDPVNRVLAADTAGTVLSATVGVAPDLARARRRLPLDGTTSSRPAADRLPAPAIAVVDVAVDANERPERSPIDLGYAYPPPHRAARIRSLLAELQPRTTDAFAEIWADTASGSAAALGAWLPAATDLRDWDGRMDAASMAAGRFAAWRSGVVRRVTAHPALAPLHTPHGFGQVFQPWLSVGPQVAAALPRLLAHPAIAPDATRMCAEAWDEASAAPDWGSTHRMLPLHVVADVPGAAAPVTGLDVAVSGDGDTVRCTGSTPGTSDRSWRGSVARWAWDLADRDRSLWSVPFGASGDPASPHFADQLAAWTEARPTRVTTDWARLRPDQPTGQA